MSRRRVVMIVEDDDDLRRIYRAALFFAGFDTVEAGDGLDALYKLDQPPRPDCLVLDLTLPRVDGHAVKAEMAANAALRQIPVVVVTGSDANLEAFGAACILRKPVTLDQIITSVRSCIAQGTST